jgi:hypothetical protein
MDGFDHYGLGEDADTNMTLYGSYADAIGCQSVTTPVRTGTYSLRTREFRRAFGDQKSSVGVGLAFYLTELPADYNSLEMMEFRDASNAILCAINIGPSGDLRLSRGVTRLEIETTGVLITTGSWFHIEVYFTPNGATSSIEIRVNETTVMNNASFPIGGTSGSNPGDTSTETSIFVHDSLISYCYVDDLYAWDTSGTYNNDFIGDKKVHTMMPDGDTSVMDWAPNTGSTEYTQIDEIGPDGDSSYIYVGAVSNAEAEFTLQAMPADAVAISAVQTLVAARKTDAGQCDIRTDIVSGALDSSGPSSAVTTSYNYYPAVFETDPNTGALWTKSGVDGAKIRIVREA